MLVVEVVVEVDSPWLGGRGGDATPGECIVPANVEKASARLKAMTAPVRRNLFIICGAS